MNSLVKINVRRRYCVHELFGFDVMLDENLKPWIIEVNISPRYLAPQNFVFMKIRSLLLAAYLGSAHLPF